MMKRQRRNNPRMLDGYGHNSQFGYSFLLDPKRAKLFRQRVLAEADLDRDLPLACRAQQQFISRIRHQCRRVAVQPRIVEGELMKRVRVEQQLHGMYSWKSARCSSSSARISSRPTALPGRRGSLVAGEAPTSDATVLSPCRIMTVSPGFSLAINSGSPDCASSTATDVMMRLTNVKSRPRLPIVPSQPASWRDRRQ